MGAGNVFLNPVEEEKLVARIAEIERKCRGEVHVHLASKTTKQGAIGDAVTTFKKLHIDRTAERNGVLIYIAVDSHELAIIGDQGIHQHVGNDGWNQMRDRLTQAFAKGDRFIGLWNTLAEIEAVLVKHFPATDEHHKTDTNELPNEFSRS